MPSDISEHAFIYLTMAGSKLSTIHSFWKKEITQFVLRPQGINVNNREAKNYGIKWKRVEIENPSCLVGFHFSCCENMLELIPCCSRSNNETLFKK